MLRKEAKGTKLVTKDAALSKEKVEELYTKKKKSLLFTVIADMNVLLQRSLLSCFQCFQFSLFCQIFAILNAFITFPTIIV